MRIVGYAGLVGCWAWVSGVVWPAWRDPIPAAVFGLLALGLALALATRRAPSLAVLCVLAAGAYLLGGARQAAALPQNQDQLRPYLDQRVTLTGRVLDDSEFTASMERAMFAVDSVISPDGAAISVTDKVMLYAAPFTGLNGNDRLAVTGKLELPLTLDGVDVRAVYEQRGVHAVVYRPQIVRLADTGNSASIGLGTLRSSLNNALARVLPSPHAAIAQGLVTGERSLLDDQTRDAFRRTGTTHLLAVSGANIALVIAFVQPLLSVLRRREVAFGATLAVIAGYAALVGPQPSVLRAALMGGLVIWARFLGRPSDGHTALAFTAVALTAIDPNQVRDLGFQLSFAATAGILLLGPSIERHLQSLPAPIAACLAMTLSAELAVLPILATATDNVSLVAPLANLAVAPLVGPSTIVALILAPLAALAEIASAPVAWLEWVLLSALNLIVQAFSGLLFATVPVRSFPTAAIVAYYAILALLAVAESGRSVVPVSALRSAWSGMASRIPAWALTATLALVAGLVWSGAVSTPPPAPVVSFLGVGQGDSALIETPSGRVVLVDGGPTPLAALQALDRRLPFWRRRVDLIVLSHPHDDHVTGLVEVLRRYDVGAVLESGIKGGSPAWAAFDREVDSLRIPRWRAATGDRVDLGGETSLSVVYAPGPQPVGGSGDVDVNNLSLVVRMDGPGGSALFTGDAGISAQRSLVQSGAALRAQILKVPHHGASDCLDPEFLRTVSPSVAVVSVGAGNRFGHPSPVCLAMMDRHSTRVLRTDEQGTVEIALSPTGPRIYEQRPAR